MSLAPPPPEVPRPRRDRTAWRWPLVTILLAGLLAVAYFVTLERFVAAGRGLAAAPGAAMAGLERLSRGLLRGEVTLRFLSSIPEVTGSPAGRLELATAEVVETISRSEERSAFWDLVPLGTTTVEIRIPVVYRYHVPMDGDWRVTVNGDRAEVVAPRLQASLPPALRTDRMERRVESDWLRFDGAARLAELERQLVPLVVARARDPRHVALARESARRSLAGFARGWLLAEGEAAGGVRTLVVRFADEDPDAGSPSLAFPVGRD